MLEGIGSAIDSGFGLTFMNNIARKVNRFFFFSSVREDINASSRNVITGYQQVHWAIKKMYALFSVSMLFKVQTYACLLRCRLSCVQ